MINKYIPGLVSIIIVNYNGKKLLEVCLPSIELQSYKHVEVFIVDNGSTDGSEDYVRAQFPHFHYYALRENTGFSHANNIAIEKSQGEYIFLLNNDTEMHEECISEFVVKAKESSQSIGMFSGKILQFSKRNIIDNTGHLIYPDGLNRGRGRLEEDHGQYDQLTDIAFPSGCAAFFRRQVLLTIGLLDEDYFLYGEDADLGIRARLAGWTCEYVPTAIIYHMYSATTGQYSEKKAYFVERNRLWLLWKNYPKIIIFGSIWFTFVRACYLVLAIVTHRGAAGEYTEKRSSWSLLIIVLRSWIDAIYGLSKILQKRKSVQKLRKVNNKQIFHWFKKYGISARELMLKA